MNPQIITIAGKAYDASAFFEEAPTLLGTSDFARQLFIFLKDWFSDSPVLSVCTSGSTGIPQEMLVQKTRMMQSARLTCAFLGLKPGDTALLCMPLEYIAGKMMVVRALVAGLDLHFVTPCGHPLAQQAGPFTFAAMVPMQVYDSMGNETEKSRVMAIKHLIIGGGAIDQAMEQTLQKFPNHVYSTYGMTETLSHIAMRKLNGPDASPRYIPFSGVHLSLGADNALVIDAPLVAQERIYTKDIAHIAQDGSFKIIGRKDNVINSGGIKIQAEEVEALLKPVISGTFAISSAPDAKFGEIVVLVTEEKVDQQLIHQALPKYYVPRKILQVDQIPLTGTQKLDRAGLKKQVLQILSAQA